MLSIIADLISLITDTFSNYLWYSDEQKDQLSNVWKRHVKDNEGEEYPLVKKAKQLLKETPVK